MTPRQYAAMTALLQGLSIAAAARAAHCGERTLYRWMQQADFHAAYGAAQARIVDEACALLKLSLARATTALFGLLQETAVVSEAGRLRAIGMALDYGTKALDRERIEERLAVLEALILKGST